MFNNKEGGELAVKEESKTASDNTNSFDNFKEEEIVTQRKTWGFKNILFAFGIFILFLIIGFVASGTVLYSNMERVILWTILCITYAIILYFLLEPGILKEVNKKQIKTVNRDIIKEVPVVKEVMVDREVIKEVPVDREVVKEVIKEIRVPYEKKVFIPTMIPRKKLDIPKYDYVASSSTKTFHNNNCRLSKSIKRKYKEYNNDSSYFRRRGYSACKVCILKQKKV